MNKKIFTKENPRVVISTRKTVRDKLRKLYPNLNTDNKKLTKLVNEIMKNGNK